MPTVSSQIPAGLPQAAKPQDKNAGDELGLAMERSFLSAFGAALGGGLQNGRAEQLVAAEGLGQSIDEPAVQASDATGEDTEADAATEQAESGEASAARAAPGAEATTIAAAPAISESAGSTKQALVAERPRQAGQPNAKTNAESGASAEARESSRQPGAQAIQSGRQSAAQVEQEALKSPSSIAPPTSKAEPGGAISNAATASNASQSGTLGPGSGGAAAAPAAAANAVNTASAKAASAAARSISAAGPAAAQPTAGVAPQGQQSPAFRLVRAENASGSQRGAPTPGKDIAQQAARGLAAALRQKGGAVTLRLNPGGLGSLKIGMQVTGGSVTARLEASSAVARGLLEAELPRLRSALEAKGLHVEKLTVVTAERSVFGTNAQDARLAADKETEQRFGDATDGGANREDGEGREPGGGAAGERTPEGRTDAGLTGVDERAGEASEDAEAANQGPGGAPGDIDDGGAELTQRLDAVV